MNTFIVYMDWVAVKLGEKGYRPINSFDNPTKPKYKCYAYEDTTEFRKALTEVTQKNKKII